MAEEQARFEVVHRQWRDTMTLTSGGKFWRQKGFRRYEITSGSAGKWVCDGNRLTLEWFKWPAEELISHTGGRTFEGAQDYKFDMVLLPGQRIPMWLVRGLTESQSLATIVEIVRSRLLQLQRQEDSAEAAQIAALLKETTSALLPFAEGTQSSNNHSNSRHTI